MMPCDGIGKCVDSLDTFASIPLKTSALDKQLYLEQPKKSSQQI